MADGNKGQGITIDWPPEVKRVHIIVTGKRKEDGTLKIVVAPNNPPYIGKKPICDGQQFEWVIVGGLENGQMLRIRDATNLHCFPSIPIEIYFPDNAAVSGPPDPSTPDDTYWTYVVELFDAKGDLIASSDPGAIIHP